MGFGEKGVMRASVHAYNEGGGWGVAAHPQ